MVVDPGTAMLIASAVAASAGAAGSAISGSKSKKASKYRSKELHRETQAQLLQDALNRSAELESHRLGRRAHLGRRAGQNMQETADLIRGAFNI